MYTDWVYFTLLYLFICIWAAWSIALAAAVGLHCDMMDVRRLWDGAAAASLSSEELACGISAGLTAPAASASSATHTDLMCLCLTLTDHIISRLTSQGPTQAHQGPTSQGPTQAHQGPTSQGPTQAHQGPTSQGPTQAHQGPTKAHQGPASLGPASLGPTQAHQGPTSQGLIQAHQGPASQGPTQAHQGPTSQGPASQGPTQAHQGPTLQGPALQGPTQAHQGPTQAHQGPTLQGPALQGLTQAHQGPASQGPSSQGPTSQGPTSQGPTSQGPTPREVRLYCEDVMGRLCQADLMAKLVSLLGCQDQLVAHLSAKCMSAYIISDICITGRCSSLWRHTCAEVFHRPTLSSELNGCLWSLTAVIKGVLRGDCQHGSDVLTKLLAALDASLTGLYSSLLPQDTVEPPKTAETQLCKTMCVFFDLLEVLSAARLRCGVCSSVQRTIFTESRALLNVLRTDVEYFVKKRALLLLKRILLRRPGEDWALGDVRPASHGDEGLNEDMCAVAEAVLQEVKAGWLQEVPAKAQASFFGGNCDAGVGGPQKDDVMLRAVSLILLKSLEINTQPSRVKGETQRNGDVQRYLTELMMFLQHHGTLSPSPHTHCCLWVSLVFAEQDDDMIESAKALIALYLYQKSLSFSVPVCLWGCNPHCHFIILLRSLSFDHTVLLDFLISTETCFLEYCVRYLKLLREDWGGFCRSCCHVEDCDGKLGGTGRGTADLVVQAQSDISETSESSEMYTSPCARPSTGSDVRAGPIPRLVEYGSSDESDEAEESSSNNHTNRNFKNTEVRFGRTEVEASFYFGKVLVCLEELKMAITRLQNRGLFPYNPTSLLKLLNNIDPKKNTVS